MSSDSTIIFKIEVDASRLVTKYPADWYHEYKQKLYQLTSLESDLPTGSVLISRYAELSMPLNVMHGNIRIEAVDTMFQYSKPKKDFKSWYVNFADEILFNHYGSSLMAQDELQVAEHPLLANIFEMLYELSKEDIKYRPHTKDYNIIPNAPTPILIEGIERRIAIDTSPTINTPNGIYGNAFSAAAWEDIKNATKILKNPLKSNIIAMEAYPGATGEYTIEQINDIFITVYTAFSAAKSQSKNSIEIHTGDWGTGAYGGNKVLTACLQLLAADTAGVDLLVFHTFDTNSLKQAQLIYGEMIQNSDKIDIEIILDKLFRMKFMWGISDGN